MIRLSGRRVWIIAGISIFLFLITGTAVWVWLHLNRDTPRSITESLVEGFSFMGVGRATTHDAALRGALEATLGSIAVETRVTIDLERIRHGFLGRHLPQLDTLNRLLNDATGARVEHRATRWTFRHAQSRNTPFKYVEFLFSDHRKLPLLIQVTANREGSPILEKIREKFHDPVDVPWEDGQGRSLVWHYQRDLLVASVLKDRFGNPEYHIVIYFTDHIEDLIDTEKAEAEKRVEIREKAVGSAF